MTTRSGGRAVGRLVLGGLVALLATGMAPVRGVAAAVPGTSNSSGSTAAVSTATGSTPAVSPTVTGPVVASGPKVAPGVQEGPDDLRLLGQSTDVEAGHAWQVHLAVTAAAPATDRLRIQAFDRLTTRTAFDQTLSGHLSGEEAWHSAAIDLSGLPADTGGGVTLAVPVDDEGSSPDLTDFSVTRDESGIFPVQVQLLDGRYDVVSTLTTYLLFVAGSPSQTGFPKLDVSLSLTLGASPPLPSSAPLRAAATPATIEASAGRLPAATVAALGGEVAALQRHPTVPVSLTVTPQTADALAALARGSRPRPAPRAATGARGSAAGSASTATPAVAAATLAGLSGLVAGDDELLPSTYVPTSLPAMSAAGLSSEIDLQFAAGSASLEADLHQVPETSTWVADGPVDTAMLELLRARGATRIIVPAADLQALPKALRTFTVAAPAELASGSGDLTVEAADQQLSTHFSTSPDQVLAANQLLAELAMIQLETPSRLRGVAVVPPAGWVANSAFLDTLLGGLSGNPLIQPVTADQLFTAIPAATGRSQIVRKLAPAPPAAPLGDASTIELARTVTSGYGAALPGAKATAAEMARRILISESSDLTTAQRSDVLGPVVAAATPLDRGISLPGRGTSITLTARKGDLPLTILDNPSLRAHVELRLSSDKLTFEPFSPPGGHCTQTSASSEVCQLVLTVAVTTIKVPVEARTSGVFTLDVGLYSPDGSLSFDTNRDTVRSTAVSGVGVILIILATVGLAYWWFRNIRHGRRARQLVEVTEGGGDDADVDEPSFEGTGKGSPDGHDAGGGDGTEDAFAEFFSSPAPRYPAPSTIPPSAAPPVSPSPGGAGPT